MDFSLFETETPSVQSERILYTPSDFAKANLIHLQEVGKLTARKRHESKRNNLTSYLFFLVLDGSGTLTYEGTTYHLKAGDCAFLDCRRAYAHHTSQELWTLKWVHFYGPNMGGIYGKYVERGGRPSFACAYAKQYEALIDELYDIADSDSYVKDMQICEKLMGLLTLLMEESWNGEERAYQNSKRRNLQAVREYLEGHFQEKIRLDALAESFYINKFYLTRIFKEQFGVSINAYLLQLRITRAKQLLRFSDKTVEEIAGECGMNDANYFSRMFKKVEGVTPGQFRKLW
ncbi:MAG: helix-turn-helix domain-containing protein [Lachnospiraceae bacterium]|nr:helix-turn-helix domain-containing protein [Lachnospiraceae bacterium]